MRRTVFECVCVPRLQPLPPSVPCSGLMGLMTAPWKNVSFFSLFCHQITISGVASSAAKEVSVAPRSSRMAGNVSLFRLRRSKAVRLAETLADGRCAGHLLASVVTPTVSCRDPNGHLFSPLLPGVCGGLGDLLGLWLGDSSCRVTAVQLFTRDV